MSKLNLSSLTFFRAAALACALAAPAPAAPVSTGTIRTDKDALEFLADNVSHNATAKFYQDYMYTGSQRTSGISSRVPVYREIGAVPLPVAPFTAKAAVPKAESKATIPPLDGAQAGA